MVPQSALVGSASVLAVLATFLNSANTLAGFFRRSGVGPRPTPIISSTYPDLTQIIVWLAAIQLMTFRNSRTPFNDESMIYKLNSDLRTIWSSFKGTTRGSLWGLFDNPRPPETGS